MYPSNESDPRSSSKSTYSFLDQTYCGKGTPPIPQIPFVTYDPPIPPGTSLPSCPANWNPSRVPNMATQVVLDSYQYPHYTALTHDTPYSSSGYFSYLPAYLNNAYGYKTHYRSCNENLS